MIQTHSDDLMQYKWNSVAQLLQGMINPQHETGIQPRNQRAPGVMQQQIGKVTLAGGGWSSAALRYCPGQGLQSLQLLQSFTSSSQVTLPASPGFSELEIDFTFQNLYMPAYNTLNIVSPDAANYFASCMVASTIEIVGGGTSAGSTFVKGNMGCGIYSSPFQHVVYDQAHLASHTLVTKNGRVNHPMDDGLVLIAGPAVSSDITVANAALLLPSGPHIYYRYPHFQTAASGAIFVQNVLNENLVPFLHTARSVVLLQSNYHISFSNRKTFDVKIGHPAIATDALFTVIDIYATPPVGAGAVVLHYIKSSKIIEQGSLHSTYVHVVERETDLDWFYLGTVMDMPGNIALTWDISETILGGLDLSTNGETTIVKWDDVDTSQNINITLKARLFGVPNLNLVPNLRASSNAVYFPPECMSLAEKIFYSSSSPIGQIMTRHAHTALAQQNFSNILMAVRATMDEDAPDTQVLKANGFFSMIPSAISRFVHSDFFNHKVKPLLKDAVSAGVSHLIADPYDGLPTPPVKRTRLALQ